MMRFEYYQNVVTKHHLGNSDKLTWQQAANWAYNNDLGKTTICSVKQLDADTIEIVKRRDTKLCFTYKWFGMDHLGLYERVTINRREKKVEVDRIDANWWMDEPFMGRRDLFYLEKRENYPEQLTFVRHDFWRHSLAKLPA